MDWGDGIVIVVLLICVTGVVVVYPMLTMADKTDNVSQLAIQTATVEFTDDVRMTGKITPSNYDKFIEEIHATGNAYDVEIEVRKLDENAAKKATQVSSDKYGENAYVIYYTEQIEPILDSGQDYNLKEGDMIYVKVRSRTTQTQKVTPGSTGSDLSLLTAESGGMVLETAQ